MDERPAHAPHLTGGRPVGAAAVAQSDAAPTLTLRREAVDATEAVGRPARLWAPRRVLVTRSASRERHGERMLARLEGLGIGYEVLGGDRLPALAPRGADARTRYRAGKETLAIVNAPPGQFALQPIPPSADYQFHLAKGCPAHCQYCYLAGSLAGPPVTRVYANLDAILANVRAYAERADAPRARRPAEAALVGGDLTFEASCYTDPLGIEHLTGSLAATIEAFAAIPRARLRWVTKYDDVGPLLGLDHGGRTRCRFSLNADAVTRRLEGGTADLAARLAAMRRLALPRGRGGGGYAVGAVLAPLMPLPDWRAAYGEMLDRLAAALDFPEVDLAFELITHRFTPGSKEVLLDWYPATELDLDEGARQVKRTKFGGRKYVYTTATMAELRGWFRGEIAARFPGAPVLYFT